MRLLAVNMYKDKSEFKKFKKNILYGLSGNKVIFKKWDDTKGIEDTLEKKKIRGIILSGSDYFVKKKDHAIIDPCIINSNIPILAICYGFQYFIYQYKKSYIKSFTNGYNKYFVSLSIPRPFYIPKSRYYLIHKDYIVKVPKTFKIIKKFKNKIIIAYNRDKNILGVQFHPEKNKDTSRAFFNMWINTCILQQGK
jgi:carbamoylphosphate synthase small subunit